jgi:hypothetical protein
MIDVMLDITEGLPSYTAMSVECWNALDEITNQLKDL